MWFKKFILNLNSSSGKADILNQAHRGTQNPFFFAKNLILNVSLGSEHSFSAFLRHLCNTLMQLHFDHISAVSYLLKTGQENANDVGQMHTLLCSTGQNDTFLA